jgi:hypothetical protein
VKLVDPTLATSAAGRLTGSMTTSGSRARDSAERSAEVSSSTTAMTARRPAAASSLAQAAGRPVSDRRVPGVRMLTTTATPSEAAQSSTPCSTSVEYALRAPA